MARFPSIDSEGAFEAPEVQNKIKELVTGSTDGITVDTSVGTRVYVGNTMIYGDTGWRTLTSWDSAGTITGTELAGNLSPTPGVRGWIRVKRENHTVTLAIRGLTISTTPLGYTLPAGFRAGSLGMRTLAQLDSTSTAVFAILPGASELFIAPTTEAKTHNFSATIVTWPTNSAWPTSLTGTPAPA